MAFTDGNSLWRFIYIAGAAMILLLAAGSLAIGQWFVGGVLAFFGLLLLLMRLPLFRLAVTREPDAVLCRYVPWYEPAPYLGISLVLGLGTPGIIAGFRPDFGPMIGIVGAFLLLMLPLVMAKFWRGYRRCRLRITPAALIVPDPARDYAELTIPRQRVLSIAPAAETVGFGSTTLVLTDITYSDGGTRTVRVGPAPADDTVWLTVPPASLLAALQDWVNTEPGDPGLLDRVDAQLRSREARTDPRRLAAVPAVGQGVAPAASSAPAAPMPPSRSLDGPGRTRRWFSRGPLSLLLVVSAFGAGYPLYRHLHRDPAPQHSATATPQAANPTCPVPGASVVALPKKSDAEPTIELPVAPGWTTRDIKDPQLAEQDSLRGYLNYPAITKDDYPLLQVTMQKSPATGEETAKDLLTRARTMFPTVTSSTNTVCGQTLYRFDTAGYNPDGKGEQTGTTVFSVVDSKDGSRWIASAFLKTKDPDNPAYIAQRDALVAGFHVGFL